MRRYGSFAAALALAAASSGSVSAQSAADLAARGPRVSKPVINEPRPALPSAARRLGLGSSIGIGRSAAVTYAPERRVVVPPGEEVVLTPVYPVHYPIPTYITPPLHGWYVPPYYLPPAHYYASPVGHRPAELVNAGGARTAAGIEEAEEEMFAAPGDGSRTTFREETIVQETTDK